MPLIGPALVEIGQSAARKIADEYVGSQSDQQLVAKRHESGRELLVIN